MTEIPGVPGRAYQVTCDPERLLIEERAKALSAAGYPLQLDDDSAKYAEQRLLEAKEAAYLSSPPLAWQTTLRKVRGNSTM